LSTTIQSAFPGSKFLFLFDNPNNWGFVEELEKAFSRALAQVTQNPSARPHLTRQVATFEFLIPGWEQICRRVLRGEATIQQCKEFVDKLNALGFNHLIKVLLQISHGHALTFIKYYFSIWDLVISIYCKASLHDFESSKQPVFRPLPTDHHAFYKAQTRAGESFDATVWLSARAIKCLDIPALDSVKSSSPSTQVDVKKNAPNERLQRFEYASLRAIGLSPDEACLISGVNTEAALKIETSLARMDTSSLVSGHQSGPSNRGCKSMESTLCLHSRAILECIDRATPASIEALLDALTPRRTYNRRPPPIDELINTLKDFVVMLIPELGLLVQVGADHLDSGDLARIKNANPRFFIGPNDSRLGGRPRISVVDIGAPLDLVRRPRLTGVMRCALAAHLLLNFSKDLP